MNSLEFTFDWLVSHILVFLHSLLLQWKKLQRSPLLLLPSELLGEILNHLDYRSLIDIRLTCRIINDILASRQFWRGLAATFRPDPILESQLDDYSNKELMQWTLRRLRSRARLNSSDPLRFRSRMIPYKKVGLTGQAELLSGGRWMFSVHEDGSGCMTDLDQEQPQPQVLFRTSRSGEASLRDSCTWIDKEDPSSSLHVAVFNRQMRANQKGRICFYRISGLEKDSRATFVATQLSVVRDGPRQAWRMSVALSKEYLVQQIDQHEESMTRLQLRRYSSHTPASATAVSEISVALNYAHLFFLPGNRVGAITRGAVHIFSFNSPKADDDTAVPNLELIHHINARHEPYRMSPPFIGLGYTYTISACGDTLKRIIIDHNAAVPPTSEEIGKFTYDRDDSAQAACFRPSACVLIRTHGKSVFDLATYKFNTPGSAAYVSCREYDQIYDPPRSRPRAALAFDEVLGRIVFETPAGGNFLVMELI